jgi:hypothetical protein
MSLTIGEWIFVAVIACVGIGVAIYYHTESCEPNFSTVISILIVTFFVCLIAVFGFSWYHNNTASGIRDMKDYRSNLDNGLEREITITAEDGREIFHYEGKIDIETSHDGSENYLLFESEEGQRYIIYYGITDTVLIIEK